jgi:hypothetical protein
MPLLPNNERILLAVLQHMQQDADKDSEAFKAFALSKKGIVSIMHVENS